MLKAIVGVSLITSANYGSSFLTCISIWGHHHNGTYDASHPHTWYDHLHCSLLSPSLSHHWCWTLMITSNVSCITATISLGIINLLCNLAICWILTCTVIKPMQGGRVLLILYQTLGQYKQHMQFCVTTNNITITHRKDNMHILQKSYSDLLPLSRACWLQCCTPLLEDSPHYHDVIKFVSQWILACTVNSLKKLNITF